MSRLLFMKFLQASFDYILKSYPISNSITMTDRLMGDRKGKDTWKSSVGT